MPTETSSSPEPTAAERRYRRLLLRLSKLGSRLTAGEWPMYIPDRHLETVKISRLRSTLGAQPEPPPSYCRCCGSPLKPGKPGRACRDCRSLENEDRS